MNSYISILSILNKDNKQYFKRELSESGNSADKRRFGWVLRQRREDRKESALFSIAVLHNIFTIRVPTG
jgi:transposase